MVESQQPKLGEVLVAAGVISQLDLLEALEEQKADPTRPRLGQVLVRNGMATEGEICRAISGQLRLPFVDLRTIALNHSVVFLIPQSTAERHQLIAIDTRGDEVMVAMSDPTNLVAKDDVQTATGKKVRPVVAQPTLIRQAIGRYYGHTESTWAAAQDPLYAAAQLQGKSQGTPPPGMISARQSIETAVSDLEARTSGPVDPLTSAVYATTGKVPAIAVEEDKPPPVTPPMTGTAAEKEAANTVGVFLSEAAKLGATEIRGEPGLEGLSIQFKVDGVYREILAVPKHMQAAVTSRVKDIAGLDIEEHHIEQEGEIAVELDSVEFYGGVKTLPGLNGEKFVIKPSTTTSTRLKIEDLGMDSDGLELFEAALKLPRGLILVVGPEGSGVTTTLHAAVRYLTKKHGNIQAIEERIEERISGVEQTQLDPAAGIDFEESLRMAMRSNPTAVMLSDLPTAEIAEQALVAAISGRLVVAGMRSADAPSAITDLVEMGVDPSMVGSGTALVVSQRLVRKVCDDCAVGYEPPKKVLEALGLSGAVGAAWRHGEGCETCSYTGYRGTTAIFQLMPVTDLMKEQLAVQVSKASLMQSAAAIGVKTLQEAGVELAKEGVTSPEEVVRVLEVVEEQRLTCPGCAAEIKPDYMVCPFCSTYLGGETCRNCGKDLQPDWMACPFCGTAREVDEKASAPKTSISTAVSSATSLEDETVEEEGLNRILVVEDDEAVRGAIERALGADGFIVIGADDGESAVRLAVRHRPHLILLDVELSGEESGIEICKQLRKTPQASLTPILFLTSNTEFPDDEEGTEDFLVKPVDEELLVKRVRERLTGA